ncbi:24028_t:CDS:1 [Entrophospora sp. SA101]|nr:6000_t:CDS:1 [Entrophospora sp. SA101]CAJ0751344.1 24028_t:CDS:1 [Entrophospora sp. SA101]CAJ0837533.1 11943_t:CDS:1 [Entrophospora sp. SA101]CAJ0878658.1 3383_t:CDS:1 [Entrophospora sp. SA101]
MSFFIHSSEFIKILTSRKLFSKNNISYIVESTRQNYTNPVNKIEYKKVFGHWWCKGCGRGWKSGYTWVALDLFDKNVNAKDFKKAEDQIYQDCLRCDKINPAKRTTKLLSYEKLTPSPITNDNNKPHKRELCEKCKSGAICNCK